MISQKATTFRSKMKKQSFTIALGDTFRQKTTKKHSFSSKRLLKSIGSILIKKTQKREFTTKKHSHKKGLFSCFISAVDPPSNRG